VAFDPAVLLLDERSALDEQTRGHARVLCDAAAGCNDRITHSQSEAGAGGVILRLGARTAAWIAKERGMKVIVEFTVRPASPQAAKRATEGVPAAPLAAPARAAETLPAGVHASSSTLEGRPRRSVLLAVGSA
jgi:hypothetical protein